MEPLNHINHLYPLFHYDPMSDSDSEQSDEEHECIGDTDALVEDLTHFDHDLNYHQVNLNKCSVQGNISCCDSVFLHKCEVSGGVNAFDSIVLDRTRTSGDVKATTVQFCKNSNIFGTLSCSNSVLRLEGCRVRNILLELPSNKYQPQLIESPQSYQLYMYRQPQSYEVYMGREPWLEWFSDRVCVLEKGLNAPKFVFDWNTEATLPHFLGDRVIYKLSFLPTPESGMRAISDNLIVSSAGMVGQSIGGGIVNQITVRAEQEDEETIDKKINIPSIEILKLFQAKANGEEITIRQANQFVILDACRVHIIHFAQPGGIVKLINNSFVDRVINGHVLAPQPKDLFTEKATIAAFRLIFPWMPGEISARISEYLDRIDGVTLAVLSKAVAFEAGVNCNNP